MNLEQLEAEPRLDIVREFAKLTVNENVRLRQENAALKKKQAESTDQIRLSLQDQLTRLQTQFFGKGTESIDEGKELRSRKFKDTLPHGDSVNPSDEPKQAKKAKDRNLNSEVSLYSMGDAELKDESMSRGHKNPKRSDWNEMNGLYDEAVEITIVERVYKKVIHRRKKYIYTPSIGTDKEVIVTAKGPEKLFPGAGYSVDFAIASCIDKYQYHCVQRVHRKERQQCKWENDAIFMCA